MRELATLLPDLAPPAGGLARLQRRLHGAQRPRALPPWRLVGAALVLVASMVVAWSWRTPATTTLADRMQHYLAPPPSGILVEHGTALALPAHGADASIYLVQSLRPPTH